MTEKEYLLSRVVEEYYDLYVDDESDHIVNDSEKIWLIFTSLKNYKKFLALKNKIIIVTDSDALESHQYIKWTDGLAAFLIYLENAEIFYRISQIIKKSEEKMAQLALKNESAAKEDLLLLYLKWPALINFEIELLQSSRTDEWGESLFNFFSKINMKPLIYFCNKSAIAELIKNNRPINLLFKLNSDDHYLVVNNKSDDSLEELLIEAIVQIIGKGLQSRDQKMIQRDYEIDFWENVFLHIPFPMAAITSEGELLIYNESFTKLGVLPRLCLSLKNQESVELASTFYIVKKSNFDFYKLNVTLIVFYVIDKELRKEESRIDELGIISSSIAHELNNPVAGILAGISLLLLEENWSEGSLEEINEMRNGAKRCKELIEIFLGISRASPLETQKNSIELSFFQALSLLRFRMIESNLRVEVSYRPSRELMRSHFNSSIMAMIFYLIMNELITALSHFRLVTQQNIPTLKGQLCEEQDQIIFTLSEDFPFEEKIRQSKLIYHLLKFEKIELEFNQSGIKLLYF